MTEQDIINEYLYPRSGNLKQMIHNFLSLDLNELRKKAFNKMRCKKYKDIKKIYINSKIFYKNKYYKSYNDIISKYDLLVNDVYFIKTINEIDTLKAIDIAIKIKDDEQKFKNKNNLNSHKYLYKPWINTNLYERWFIHEL